MDKSVPKSDIIADSPVDPAYLDRLFNEIPLYTTRLVREHHVPRASRPTLRSPRDVMGLLVEYFKDKDREVCLALYLDTSNTVIGVSRLTSGGLSSSILEPRQVFKEAVLLNAACVILVHHHPSGNPEPSREDIRITRQMCAAGSVMGIPVRDHVIVAEETFTSLAERGVVES